MAKKYNPEKVKLSLYEEAIENSVDYSKLKKPSASAQNKLKASAAKALKEIKSARANIRMSENDLEAIRALAERSGMPYQTFIAYVLHLYITDQLIHVHEVKKMIDAGIFNRKIS